MRIYSHTGFHAKRLYLLDISVQVRAGFNMDRKIISAGIFKFFRIFFRLIDHQVHITNFGGSFSEKFNDHGSKTDIGNKTSIHYIKMKPVGLAVVKHIAFLLKLKSWRLKVMVLRWTCF